MIFFFFQAEDGIRDAQESRGLGDVYKRQDKRHRFPRIGVMGSVSGLAGCFQKTGSRVKQACPG